MPQYGRAVLVAACCLTIAVLVKVALARWADPAEARFMLLLGAVFLSMWFGGRVAGMVALVGATLIELFGFGLYSNLIVGQPRETMRLISFLAEGSVIFWLTGRLHARLADNRQRSVAKSEVRGPMQDQQPSRRYDAGRAVAVESALDPSVDAGGISERQAADAQLARQAQEAELLFRATQIATETESVESALKGAIDIICELIGWPVGHAYVPSADGQLLEPTRIWHFDDAARHADFLAATERSPMAMGVGLPGRVWQSGQPEWIPNVQTDANFPRNRMCEVLHLKAAFGFPVRVGNETAAVLEFFHEREIPPDARLMLLGRSVGEQLGRVIERKRSQAELGDSRARLGYTLQAARVATWDWNITTGETRWSPNMTDIHGLAGPGPGTWDDILATIHSDDRARIQQAVADAVRECRHLHEEYRIERPDGGEAWIESQAQVTCDSQGVPVRMGGICRDVTERRRNADELMAAKVAAEAASRAKSEFLANISHELRTPMNAIIGMTELALQDAISPAVRDYLQTAHDSAGVLLRLLNDLLDFSKLEAGRFVLDSAPFELRATLDEAIKVLSLQAYEKGLELACHVAADVPDAVVGDPDRLQQVVYNLVGNAIKFTPKGEVVVRVECVSCEEHVARLRFAVSDTGIGIPPEAQQSIFAPFVQVDASSTRQFGGTGLGLTIASQLVAMMGGRIEVESPPGGGSTFRFDIQVDVRPAERDRTGIAARLAGLRVLVVDDNATNRKILAEMLASWSIEVESTASGPAALEAMRQAQDAGRSFPLVLLDALMPGMDGFTVAERIKSDNKLAGATVLMLSSADRQVFAQRCAGLNLAAFLEKPVSQSGLLTAIADALGWPEGLEEESRHHPASAGRPLSILVAEDTPANQKLVVAILRKRGHAVTVANNGREAVDLFGSRRFDVGIMDVQMPTMDGLQATAAIRQMEDGAARLPIIALTAHALQGDRDRCLAAGADAYLAKPIDAARLIELVEELANRRSPAGHSTARRMAGAAVVKTQGDAMTKNPAGLDLTVPLERMGGDQSLLAQLAQMFLEDSPGLLATIATSIGNGNLPELERAAHSLKGLAANFDAHDAVAAALRLEDMGRTGQLDEAPAALDAVGTKIGALRKALQDWLATLD
jgi:two-component system, sensor histidine kinase and response regulator